MGTQHRDLFAALAAPFGDHEVKSRTISGREIRYVTARTVMIRLDDVLGPENWWCHPEPFSDFAVRVHLTIRLPDGSTVTKTDLGAFAKMAANAGGKVDAGDDDKAGVSDGLKRAAVLFGIARELYRDGVAEFVEEHRPEPAPRNQPGRRQEPRTPPPGRGDAYEGDLDDDPGRREVNRQFPGQGQRAPREATWSERDQGAGRPADRAKGQDRPPTTGRALFAWSKKVEQEHNVGMLRYLTNWAKLQGFPERIVDFDAEQVGLAYQEATRKLAAHANAAEEALAN